MATITTLQMPVVRREKPKLQLRHSLRFRIILMVAGVVLGMVGLFAAYAIEQFGEATELAVLHEGELLSDAIESSIAKMADRNDITGIQAYLDRLVRARNMNDVEMNVMFVRGAYSDIVASNNPDNIEQADEHEHADTLRALAAGRNNMFIEVEDPLEEDDNPEDFINPDHPDYYFQPGYRFISITTPLAAGTRGIGSINIKLSLTFLDQKLASVYRNIALAGVLGLLLLTLWIAVYVNSRVFNPLWDLAENMFQFGIRAFGGTPQHVDRPDEIGVLAREFAEMVKRLSLAEESNERYQRHLKQLVMDRTSELAATQEATILSMASLAEYRDPETGGHIKRTQNYVKALALKLRENPKFRSHFDDDAVEMLYKSAPLHDIGKVGIPDHILLKPGKLTDAEFEEMKQHTTFGRDAILAAENKLGSNSFLRFAREIAYTHQEKWDGSGYPQALQGEEIPISGRLMAVADVYDALISRRCYKSPFPHTEAVEIITDGRGTHFDPDMVDAFLELAETFREIAHEYAESEEEREAVAPNRFARAS